MYSSRHSKLKGPPNLYYYNRNNHYSYGQYPLQTPPPKYSKMNSSYSSQCKYQMTEPDVDFSEIKMNFNMLNEKLNNLKNMMDDDKINLKYYKPSYYREKSLYKDYIKRAQRNNAIANSSDYRNYYDYSDNYLVNNTDINVNDNCNRSCNMFLLKSNFNFEITTPNKKEEINEENSDDNLSEIADDLVNNFQLDDKKDTLKSSNEINITLSNNTPNDGYEVTSGEINISYNQEKKKKEERKKSEDTIVDEDDLILQEIMKKVQEDTEKDKARHVAFNLKENININYKDTNEVISFNITNANTNENIKITPRKMYLYYQILKSKSKPIGIIKPFSIDSIKIDKDYVPDISVNSDDIDDDSEEEEKGQSTIDNIKKMFN